MGGMREPTHILICLLVLMTEDEILTNITMLIVIQNIVDADAPPAEVVATVEVEVVGEVDRPNRGAETPTLPPLPGAPLARIGAIAEEMTIDVIEQLLLAI